MRTDLSLLIVEASTLFVERLRDILDDVGGINIAAVVNTEDLGLAAVRDGSIDLVLLDLSLRQGSGFGLLRAIARLAVRPLTIVLADYDGDRYRRNAMAWGAKYFFDKTKDLDQLCTVLEGIRDTHARERTGPEHVSIDAT